MLYLPQDRTLLVNQPVEVPGETVVPSQIVEHLIRRAAHHVVMNRCICRDAEGCRDYPVDLGCLFLGEAALGIHPALSRRVSREEALEHARRCREAGLVHLVGRNRLDTVWLGVGPRERLLTICHCCPCCCLWRVLPDIAPGIGRRVTGVPGVSVTVTDRCTGCGTCTQAVCFVDAIRLVDGRAAISGACRGCSRCAVACPHGAIEVRADGSDVIDASLRSLTALVDLS